MNRLPDVEPVLRAYLADTGDRAPDRVLEDVAARIARQPRRPWRLRGRPFMNPYAKLAAAAAAIVLVAFVGYNLLPRAAGPGGPSIAPTPTAGPTSTPVATGPVDLPSGTLTAGRYRIQPPSYLPSFITVDADIPAGWTGFPEGPALFGPERQDLAIAIGFTVADGLFSDPCQWNLDGSGAGGQPGDVVVGPTVNDLVEALRANASYSTSAPSPVTLGGFQGSRVELTLPGDDVLSTCDWETGGDPKGLFYVFSGKEATWYAQGPDSRWDLSILDVAGTRLIVMISSFPDTPPADLAAAEAIVQSMEFTP